jgi:hypothetical protein
MTTAAPAASASTAVNLLDMADSSDDDAPADPLAVASTAVAGGSVGDNGLEVLVVGTGSGGENGSRGTGGGGAEVRHDSVDASGWHDDFRLFGEEPPASHRELKRGRPASTDESNGGDGARQPKAPTTPGTPSTTKCAATFSGVGSVDMNEGTFWQQFRSTPHSSRRLSAGLSSACVQPWNMCSCLSHTSIGPCV